MKLVTWQRESDWNEQRASPGSAQTKMSLPFLQKSPCRDVSAGGGVPAQCVVGGVDMQVLDGRGHSSGWSLTDRSQI